jgi:FkbM family methyltransferase
MTFISYAQNFEDVMLWRALKHIENGFYIDVGAWSPDIHSVTRAFYEHGWRGINVEPTPEFHTQLQMRRPRDINLRIAVCDKPGAFIIDILINSGLSTLDETIAQKHARAGWTIDKQAVEATTLAILWSKYVPKGQNVHFLKVDVEGLEEAVLRGNDWLKCRPWIVVVEATLPMSQQECYEGWEPVLSTAGYRFAYADGLNRFYVANEHESLLSAFNYPPNVFDDFKLNELYQAEHRAQEAETKTHQLNRELQAVYASRSWRITRPLRKAFCALSTMRLRFPHIPCWDHLQGGIRGLLGSILARMINFSLAHPKIKVQALALLHRSPALEGWLRRFAAARSTTAGSMTIQVSSSVHCWGPTEPSSLTLSARCIYFDLENAIERHNKGDS